MGTVIAVEAIGARESRNPAALRLRQNFALPRRPPPPYPSPRSSPAPAIRKMIRGDVSTLLTTIAALLILPGQQFLLTVPPLLAVSTPHLRPPASRHLAPATATHRTQTAATTSRSIVGSPHRRSGGLGPTMIERATIITSIRQPARVAATTVQIIIIVFRSKGGGGRRRRIIIIQGGGKEEGEDQEPHSKRPATIFPVVMTIFSEGIPLLRSQEGRGVPAAATITAIGPPRSSRRRNRCRRRRPRCGRTCAGCCQ